MMQNALGLPAFADWSKDPLRGAADFAASQLGPAHGPDGLRMVGMVTTFTGVLTWYRDFGPSGA